ncbi:hypothetical protein D1641_11415 [Colidextribacter sp. OB.20]|nr:hypothetical protein [Colidextribacter sp. OB.20]
MFGVPFCGFFPLIFFDGDFDLPQHRLAPQADRRTQLRDGVLGVEVKNAQEILMFKVVFRLQAAAGHEGICDADGGGVSELRSDVELIILLQKAAVNDAEDVLLVIVPIFRRKLGGDLLKLFHEVAAGHVKPLLQRRRYRVLIFLPVLPQLGPGFLSAAGVSHIEHIAQKGPAAAVVDDGDTRGSPPHIPAHPLVPEIIFRAGGSVGPLGVNQELFGVRIFLKMLSRGNVRLSFYLLLFYSFKGNRRHSYREAAVITSIILALPPGHSSVL